MLPYDPDVLGATPLAGPWLPPARA